MERSRAFILALVMLLAMLASEPARAAWLASGPAASAERCGCEGSCCGEETAACEDAEPRDGGQKPIGHERESCACMPSPVRAPSVHPAVTALVVVRGALSIERIEPTGDAFTRPVGDLTAARLVGPGRSGVSQSVGERLARWCLRQV